MELLKCGMEEKGGGGSLSAQLKEVLVNLLKMAGCEIKKFIRGFLKKFCVLPLLAEFSVSLLFINNGKGGCMGQHLVCCKSGKILDLLT